MLRMLLSTNRKANTSVAPTLYKHCSNINIIRRNYMAAILHCMTPSRLMDVRKYSYTHLNPGYTGVLMVCFTFRPPYPRHKAAGTPLDSMLSRPHSLYERNGEETKFTVLFGNLTPIVRYIYIYIYIHVFGNICTCILVISVLVFTVLCIICTVFLYCFVYVYLFLFVLSVLV